MAAVRHAWHGVGPDRWLVEWADDHCPLCEREVQYEERSWSEADQELICDRCAEGRQCALCGAIPEDGLVDAGELVCRHCWEELDADLT